MNRDQYEIYHENKEHTAKDFPYNTYLCSIPLDFRSVSLHWHQEIELIVIKKGCGIVSVDLVSYEVTAGDIVFVSSGQLHSIMQKEHEIMEYENILFKADLFKSSGYDLCYEEFLSPLFLGNQSVTPVLHAGSEQYDSLNLLICEIDSLCDRRPFAYQLAVKSNLLRFFYLLISVSEQHTASAVNKKSLEKIKSLLSYIAEHYQHEITIEEAARHCYYSKSYFMKFFKELMGMSFIQYLNDYRLEAAARLLATTSDNIYDIALETGFENLSYFNRCFKKKYGMTPGKYRKAVSQ